jgi:hypothetical protein
VTNAFAIVFHASPLLMALTVKSLAPVVGRSSSIPIPQRALDMWSGSSTRKITTPSTLYTRLSCFALGD